MHVQKLINPRGYFGHAWPNNSHWVQVLTSLEPALVPSFTDLQADDSFLVFSLNSNSKVNRPKLSAFNALLKQDQRAES